MKISAIKKNPLSSIRFASSDRLVDNETAVGIEFELEGLAGFTFPEEFKYWKITHDGSLRNNGLEFISGGEAGVPLVGKNIVLALDEFRDDFININRNKNKRVPETSGRTSVHVHVDVRDLTNLEVYKMLLLYTIFEKPLFEFAGRSRENNAYCVPFYNNQEIIKYLNGLSDEENFIRTLRYAVKYSACNIKAIEEKGSIEFRAHRGCYDTETVLNWVNILLSLKKYAKAQLDMDFLEIPAYVSSRGIEEFSIDIFTEKYYKLLKYPRFEEEVLQGVRLAQEIAYMDNIVRNQIAFNNTESLRDTPKEDLLIFKLANSLNKEFNEDVFANMI